MEIRAVTAGELGDVQVLFAGNATTRGCYCMWFLRTDKEVMAGWGGGNREAFERMTTGAGEPVGVLAYDEGGQPVGWCATGPRSRYARALRSPILAGHDPAEDDHVWLVPCFFVRVGSRRAGLTEELLAAAVDLAAQHGAAAIEAFPLAGAGPHKNDRYLGTEPLFAACGFTEVARPSARRVVMRRELNGSRTS
jgi:GNAT superfamily N-acetyltransferase